MKEVYDVIYLSDSEIGINSSGKKGGRPCIIISIDPEGNMNYVLPLTSKSKYWNEDDNKYFLKSLGSYVDINSKPVNVTYTQIKYGELSEDLILSEEDISFIELNF